MELNHEESNKEQTKTNKQTPQVEKDCDRKIYSFHIAVWLSFPHLKMIEWNLKQCNMGTRNDRKFIKDLL